ncbi:hypothetical protein H0H87_003457 [Tephrocybe sp. NHM501043]|nr:hypothetical protein H0H87_003457 [Tephrocybe sp. NHM501043]
MPRPLPQTPSRRSKRGKPLATSSEEADNLYRAWSGQPLYIRPINRVLDEDIRQLDKEAEEEDEDEDETVFYMHLEMEKRAVFERTEDSRATYQVGDTVLVESDGLSRTKGPPSIGVILAMWEIRKNGSQDASDPAKMWIRLQWFLRPGELGAHGAKREPLQNEIYYKINGRDIIRPQCILSHCNVTSKPPATTQLSNTKGRPNAKRGPGYTYELSDVQGGQRNFYCRFAYQTKGDQRGFYNVDWEKHRDGANASTTNPPLEIDLEWGSGALWDVELPTAHKRKKSVKNDADKSESEEGNATDDNFEAPSDVETDDPVVEDGDEGESDDSAFYGGRNEPRTPSKKRKRGTSELQSPKKRRNTYLATPRKPGKRTIVHPTPHSKAALKKRAKAKGSTDKFAIRPETLSFSAHDLSHLPEDPWLRSMNVLHVGSRPDALPCREEEFEKVLRCVGELLEEGSGGCVCMTRINFSPYKPAQLQTIVHARLKTVKDYLEEDAQEALSDDAVKLAAMKVSAISGDARRVLDICRRAVELAMAEKRTARAPEVTEVIRAMQNSPTAAYLRECSFHERMMLTSLIKCIKREGVQEIKWGEVQHQHLVYMNVLTSSSDPTRKPTAGELTQVLDSLVASRAMLIEDGAATQRKPEADRLVVLNLDQSEVERILGEVGGTRWKNVLST